MPMLKVVCKTKGCGLDFATGINVDKESFKTCTFTNNGHVCPRGHSNNYSKPDYHF